MTECCRRLSCEKTGCRGLQADLQSVRQIMGQVPQDMVLFNDTIYYNILYGRLDASPQEVHQARLLLGFHHRACPGHSLWHASSREASCR